MWVGVTKDEKLKLKELQTSHTVRRPSFCGRFPLKNPVREIFFASQILATFIMHRTFNALSYRARAAFFATLFFKKKSSSYVSSCFFVYLHQNKKGRKPEGKKCHTKTMRGKKSR
jgi:hypothetical protein